MLDVRGFGSWVSNFELCVCDCHIVFDCDRVNNDSVDTLVGSFVCDIHRGFIQLGHVLLHCCAYLQHITTWKAVGSTHNNNRNKDIRKVTRSWHTMMVVHTINSHRQCMQMMACQLWYVRSNQFYLWIRYRSHQLLVRLM